MIFSSRSVLPARQSSITWLTRNFVDSVLPAPDSPLRESESHEKDVEGSSLLSACTVQEYCFSA